MKPTCLNCGGQGWTQSPHVYDCTQCDMAETRTALEAALRADEAKNGLMGWEDRLLFAYNFKMEKTMSDENAKSEPAVEGSDYDLFAGWKAYPLDALDSEGRFDKDWLNREFIAFKVGRRAAPVAQPLAPSGAVPFYVSAAAFEVLISHDCSSYATDIFRDPGEGRVLIAAQPLAGQDGRAVTEWQPIETAPQDGRTLLLGRFNSMGNWRTMRGQWFNQSEIDDEWSDSDGCEAGWYETSVENDERCWSVNPTHWHPLPAAPSQQPAASPTEAK